MPATATLRKSAKPAVQQINILERAATEYQRLVELDYLDLPAVDFLCVCVLGQWLHPAQDGIWGYLCAPASGTKSELILGCLHLDDDLCVYRDEMTANCGVSGYRGDGPQGGSGGNEDGPDEDPSDDLSLMSHVEGKCLMVKDLSALLEIPKIAGHFYAFLRSAYDGSHCKQSATAGARGFTARFGVLAGIVSSVLDSVMTHQQACGERFVALRIHRRPLTVDEAVSISRLLENRTSSKEDLRASVRTAMAELLQLGKTQVEQGYCTSTPAQQEMLTRIAYWLAMVRTQPRKDRPTAHLPADPEFHIRLNNVLRGVAHTRARLEGRDCLDDTDIQFVKRVAHDTISMYMRLLLDRVMLPPKTPTGYTSRYLSDHTGLAQGDVSAQLRQWRHARILTVRTVKGGEDDDRATYQVEPSARQQLAMCGLLSPKLNKMFASG